PSSSARGACRSAGTTATTRASTHGACCARGTTSATREETPGTSASSGELGDGVALAPLEAVAHQRFHDRPRLRIREVEALAQIAAERSQLRQLARRLDTLGSHRQTQRVTEVYDRRDDRGSLGVATQPVDERAVDLQ